MWKHGAKPRGKRVAATGPGWEGEIASDAEEEEEEEGEEEEGEEVKSGFFLLSPGSRLWRQDNTKATDTHSSWSNLFYSFQSISPSLSVFPFSLYLSPLLFISSSFLVKSKQIIIVPVLFFFPLHPPDLW